MIKHPTCNDYKDSPGIHMKLYDIPEYCRKNNVTVFIIEYDQAEVFPIPNNTIVAYATESSYNKPPSLDQHIEYDPNINIFIPDYTKVKCKAIRSSY